MTSTATPARILREARAEATWLQRNRMTVTPILFLLPGMLFFCVYVIAPVFQSFNISLYDWDGLGEARYIGLANYEELLTDRNFEISLWNNVKWLSPESASTSRCSSSPSCCRRLSWASCSRGPTCPARAF